MPQYLISYDLKATDPSPYGPMLDNLQKQGLLYVIKGTDLHRLPNTTVWGVFPNAAASAKAFERARAATAKSIGRTVVVEKRVVVRFVGGGTVLSDKRKPPERRWTGTSGFETCRLHQINDPFFA